MRGLLNDHALPDHVFTMPLLRAVATADHELIRRGSRIGIYGSGDAIYRQGAASRALALLIDGRAKLSVPSLHGKELVVSLIEPGQSFGEIGFLDGLPRSLDATAILPSRVLLVRRAVLLEVMRRTPAFSMAFAEAMCRRLRRTTAAVQQAVFYGVEARLAECLLNLPKTLNANDRANVQVITVWQHELAAMVGVTRESINKHLRAWHARDLVRLSRGRVALIDVAGLSAVARTGFRSGERE
jgi:CRP/FNR family cyclic AMP-dependent transcriptional regulator